ncbi:MAG: aminotransferase class V-fold PLP-dependent enzyme [Chloroflexota bacterium]
MYSSTLQETMRQQLTSTELLQQASAAAIDYLGQIENRPIYPDDATVAKLSAFDELLPDSPQNASDILSLLHELGSPATSMQIGGRYFGFVNGGIIPVTLAAKWLTDTWDQNAGLYVMSPIVSTLEHVCEQWLCDLFNLPDDTAAGFVSGTSTATMCGLAAGRYCLLQRLGWDVNEQGLFDAPKLRVVTSDQAHGTVFKALALLGLGTANIERVPADDQGRLDITQMPTLDDHTLVVAQAGNVASGSFDPLGEICDRANEAGAWVHVDGAFGLWAATSPSRSYLTEGMEKAHSWSTDGHKTLNTPYDSGIVMCHDRSALVSAMQATGSYIQYSEQRDGMLYTPEMSRRARSVELWAALKFLGRQGAGELIDGLCDRAVQFGELLGAEGFTVLNDVVFNQCLVACDSPEETQATLANIQRSGECWCGGTTWQGKSAIRVSVCSWATTPADVERSVAAFVKARSMG